MKIWIEFAIVVIMALLLWTSCKTTEELRVYDCGCHGDAKNKCFCSDFGQCGCDVTVNR